MDEIKTPVPEEAATPAAAVGRIEAEASSIASVNAHIDIFWRDVVANVSADLPTTAHNTLHGLTETLRIRILSLL